MALLRLGSTMFQVASASLIWLLPDGMGDLVKELPLLQPNRMGELIATAWYVNHVETLEKVHDVNDGF